MPDTTEIETKNKGNKGAPPPQAPPAPAPPAHSASEELAQRASRASAEKAIRDKIRPVFEAFRGPPVGMNDTPAALLAAHVYESEDEEMLAMTREELQSWAQKFAKLHPHSWFGCKSGNINGFAFALVREHLVEDTRDENKRKEPLSAVITKKYAEIASIVRG